jgi:hypothetical protein
MILIKTKKSGYSDGQFWEELPEVLGKLEKEKQELQRQNEQKEN